MDPATVSELVGVPHDVLPGDALLGAGKAGAGGNVLGYVPKLGYPTELRNPHGGHERGLWGHFQRFRVFGSFPRPKTRHSAFFDGQQTQRL